LIAGAPPTLRPGDLGELFAAASGDTATVLGGRPLLLVDATVGAPPPGWSPGSVPVVVVGVVDGDGNDVARVDPEPYDVVLAADDPMLAALMAQIERCPVAAVSLAVLLRASAHRSIEEGLAAESAVYSTLQAGSEFEAWRRSRGDRGLPPDPEPPVLVERRGDDLHVTLNRPRRHNAVTAALRDGLAEAFTLAAADGTISAVHLSGNGPSFCSGGDLDEFGSFPDPATAHVVRLTRSPARLAHQIADRLHVHLHGACMGAGIEVPALAGHVVAAADAVISLPELSLGLVPGAGGTASIPRRIGRHRTAALALSGMRIDATTALGWGLVDEVAEIVD
jgi:enoyl-CoA hydratase/carnithine racemase